jgi:oligoendopeptidase F
MEQQIASVAELNAWPNIDSQTVKSWEQLKPLFEYLEKVTLKSKEELWLWLKQKSELEALIQEELGWRYIRQTCDTKNEEKRDSLNYFLNEIEPHVLEFSDKFNQKLLSSPYFEHVKENGMFVYGRGVRKEIELFRLENIPLQTEIQTLANTYGQIMGAMSVEIDGKELTFQQAANLLKSPDRNLRRSVYEKIGNRRLSQKDELDELFDKLISLRNQVASNAGYENFRDYMFDALGRFDYSSSDCERFHVSIKEHIVPLIDIFDAQLKEKLALEILYPWDHEAVPDGEKALLPFEKEQDLIEKTILCFSKLKHLYGDVIVEMKNKGHLDLDSRLGKAPGGYNYPLYKTGLPFIFMNAAGNIRDMVTMMHEGGHAIHSFLSRDLEITGFKNVPSEIAEVASMAMELISMEHWDVFFPDKKDLKKAKSWQMEKVLSTLPWIAVIDEFQHWLYTHPNHTHAERKENWIRIFRSYSGKITDRSLYPDFEAYGWHKQLHLFEVPFYYIEYAIAQLGAIGIWRNFCLNPQKALQDYENALSAGYTKTLPELYEIAGIRFDFSSDYVKELVDFVISQKNKNDEN